jgi:hypothetical protein
MTFGRITRIIFLSVYPAYCLTGRALAFCPMCKVSVANAENAADLSPAINAAALVLLAPTLLIICGLVRLVFKYSQAPNDEESK